MSAVARNAAQAAGKVAGRAASKVSEGRDTVLKKGAKRDPELYVRIEISRKASMHTDRAHYRSYWVSCPAPLVWQGSTSAANQPQPHPKQKYLLQTARCHGKSITTMTTHPNISNISIIRKETGTKHRRMPQAPSTRSLSLTSHYRKICTTCSTSGGRMDTERYEGVEGWTAAAERRKERGGQRSANSPGRYPMACGFVNTA